MHIVAFVTQKGGAGKSTLASNFAVAAHIAGERVFICDLDPLQSLVKWSRLRKAVDIPVEHIPPEKLAPALRSLERSGLTLVVLDTPGADSEASRQAIRAAHFCVVPARPNLLDLWASEDTVARIKAAGKDYAFLLNQCPPAQQSGRVQRGARALQEMGGLLNPMVSMRVDYQEAVQLGLGVCELRPGGLSAGEMTALWAGVQARLADKARDRLAASANPLLASYRELFDQAAKMGDLYADFLRALSPLERHDGSQAPIEEDTEAGRRRGLT